MFPLRAVLSVLLLACAPAATAQQLQLFFGLMHSQTSFSDGSGKPDDAFAMAKNAGLDFFAVTEHSHPQAAGDDGVFLTAQLHEELIESAENHTEVGEFLAIWGQEVSTISKGNHENIFFADEVCDMPNGDFKFLYEDFLADHTEVPFIQFNHPDAGKDQNPNTPSSQRNNDYGIDDYGGDFDDLLQAAGNHVALIELIIGPAFSDHTDKPHHNGVHEDDYLFYLNKGFRLAPSAGQDNHEENWGVATHARMGVWATALTKDGIVEAIQHRRCYASEDENAQVRFTVNGSIMGSIILLDGSASATIKVSAKDPDEDDATYRVRLFYDKGIGGDEAQVVENETIGQGGGEIVFHHTPEPGGYYFAKVTQDSDHNDDIWTAPVWIADPSARLALAMADDADDLKKSEITWDEAVDYVSQEVTVTGRVIRSFKSRDDGVFFNFDDDYQNTLTLVLLKSDFDEFGGEDALDELQAQLMNKVVRVKGEISLYRDERIQLRLTDKNQIQSVQEKEGARAEPPPIAAVEPRQEASLEEVIALLRELRGDVAELKQRLERLEAEE
jgi:hypothetical protein